MKIVGLFIPGFGGGGAENVFVMLANFWVSRGFSVHFLVCKGDGPMRSRLDERVKVIVLKDKGGRLLRRFFYTRQLSAYCRDQCLDILLTTLTYCNQTAAMAKYFWGLGSTRLVLREANSLDNIRKAGRFQAKLNFILMRIFYPKADWVSANSDNTLNELERELGLPSTKRVLIRNPVELHELPNKQATGRRIILGVGRLIPQKDFPTLLRAFAIVSRQATCRLVILGEGPERERLEDLAVELGFGPDLFVLPGFVGVPKGYYQQADLFVLPSKWEGLPNVVLEALSHGLPVVATDCSGGTREIFEGVEGDFLVEVGDHDAMASKILDVLENPPIPEKMQFILTGRYDVATVANAYVSLAK